MSVQLDIDPRRAEARRDWITDGGILVVGLAAAILTFTTLRDLGESVGYREVLFGILLLAWLLPVTIDVAGVVAARVWLRAIGPDEAVGFARTLTWTCIGLSVLGNAGRHVMVELGVVPPWYVVVLVTAVPPAMLGAVVHLGNLVRRPLADRADEEPTAARPLHSWPSAPADWVPPAPVYRQELDAYGAAPAGAAVGPVGDDPTVPDREPTDEYDRGLDSTAHNDVLVDDLERWAADRGRPPSRDDVIRAYAVGATRARTLRRICGWPRGEDEEADRSAEEPTAVGTTAR